MTHSDATIKHAARILRKRAEYSRRPFAEIVLAVSATAILSANAANAAQLARDTYRSENGHESRASRYREASGIVDNDGKALDIADSSNFVAEFDDSELTSFVAGKIRERLGADIADGISEGLPLRDIATILGTSAATICRRIADVRESFCGDVA